MIVNTAITDLVLSLTENKFCKVEVKKPLK